MRPRFPVRVSVRTLASATTLAVTVGAFAVIAFAAKGYPLQHADLNDAGVWVTDQSIGALGRFNTSIYQLDSDIIANHATSPDVDVLQEDATVFSIDRTANTLRQVDVANVVLSNDAVDLPTGADVSLGGQTVGVVDPATGRLWVRPTATVMTLNPAVTKPLATVGAGASVAVATDGTTYAYSASTRTLVTVTGGAKGQPVAGRRQVGVGGGTGQVTAVGTRPVVLAGDTILLPDGGTATLPTAAGVTLQQPGPAASDVYAASDTALFRVDLASGTVTTVYSGGRGDPAAPVYLGSCVYAAWSGSGTYLRRCAGSAAQPPVRLQGLPVNPEMVFRVNRGSVVLNEVALGALYVYTRGGAKLGNWQALQPLPQPDPAPSRSQPTDGEHNHQPTASPDSYGARPGATSILHVLDNDGDPDSDVLVISAITGLKATAGRVAVVANGEAIQFTADPLFTQTAQFTYTINDGRGGSASAKVTLTARSPKQNQPPAETPRHSVTTVAAGGTVSYNVLADWRDPDGDPLTLVDASTSDPDAVQFTADGKVTFTANRATPGNRTVTVKVSDNTATVTGSLMVGVVADGTGSIVANDDRVTGVAGQNITIKPLANDTDPNTTAPESDATLQVTSVSPAPGGTTVGHDVDTINFLAPRAGTYYLSYGVTDSVKTAKGLVRVDVVAPLTSAPPVAVSDRAILRGTQPDEVDVLANDIDAAGDVLAIQSIAVPPGSGLNVTVVAHRWLRITALQPSTGVETLHYTVSDGTGNDVGEVDVTQLATTSTNQPPTPRDDNAIVRAGDVTTLDVLSNDTDPEGERLSIASVTPESGGGRWIVAGRDIRFLAPAKSGSAQATYTVVDPEGAQAAATVTVNVTSTSGVANEPPQPPTVEARLFAGTSVRIPIPLTGVDPNGDSVALLGAIDAPRLGRITEEGAGYLVYQAYANSAGTDSFVYRIEDAYGARGTGTVRVGVIPKPAQDSAPTAVNDDYTVAPGTSIGVPVLINDSDVDGDPLRVEPLRPLNPHLPAGTTLSGNTIGMRSSPDDGGVVQVQYGVGDGHGQRAVATVTITSRRGANVPPVAVDDVAPDLAPGATTVTVDVLANDYDIDGGAGDLTMHAMDTAAKTPSRVSDGKLLIALGPQPRLVPYEITDRGGLSAVAFVQVPGTAIELPRRNPKAPELAVNVGGTVVVPIADQVLDPGNLPVRLTDASGITTSPRPGLELVPAQLTPTSLTLHAAAGYVGPASLAITVTDAPATGPKAADVAAHTATITIPVTVLPAASAKPVFACPPARPQSGSLPVTVDLATCVSGISPKAAAGLSFSTPNGVAGGVTAKIDGTTLTIGADEKAKTGVTSTMTFTVTDALGVNAPAHLAVLVQPAPLAIATADTFNNVHAGTTVTHDVVANDVNPFPGKPLTVLDVQVISGGVTARRAGGTQVAVTAAAGYHGRALVVYREQDATGDPKRVVQGEIVINVVGKPGVTGQPHERSVGSGTAVIQWAGADANGSPITGYRVTGTPSFSQTCAATVVCQLTGLKNGTKYRFTVQAVNDIGVGPTSPASAVIEPDQVPDQPTAPTTLFGDSSMTVSWSAPHSGGSAITYYLLQVSPPDAGGQKKIPAGTTRVVWSGLTNGTTYTFRVQAFNDAPKGSDWSPYSAGDVPAKAPDRPAAPTAQGINDGIGQQMAVQWQAPNTNGATITAYQLIQFRAGVQERTYDEDADTLTATVPVVNGTDYTFEVTATNKAGVSAASPQSAAQVAHGQPAVMAAPSVTDNSGGVGYDRQIHYTVAPPDDNGEAITRYEFNYTGGTSADYTSSSTTGSIGGLTNGNSYQVSVRACNDHCGDWSALSAAVSPYGPPPMPNAGAAQSGARQVNVSWSSNGTNGRSITVQINVNGGGWQNVATSGNENVGNGPNQNYSIQVREQDSAGQVSSVATAQATTQPSTVQVSRGASTVQTTCHAPCEFIHVQLNNFASNTAFTCSFDSQHGGGFVNLRGTTDGNGNFSADADDWYGYNGEWVSASCNGVNGRDDSW